MCGIICSVVTIVVGCILVVVASIVGYVVVPDLVASIITNEVVLIEDTIQMERFEVVPFAVNFTVRIFNISNSQEVLNGAVPIMNEIGPYVYKLYQRRNITSRTEDKLTYKMISSFEFDPESSYPNREDDVVTIVNVPYHAIIQIAESSFAELLPILNLAMRGVFGEHNGPIAQYKVRDLLFDGISLCQNPGLTGAIACNVIRDIGQGAQNLVEQEDGSVVFSLVAYKYDQPSKEYEVYRGMENSDDLGRITLFDQLPHFLYWMDAEDGPGVCNMINGTDAGIYAPFINTELPVYAINTDICRSVELRYQRHTISNSIPTVRFSANEWFLDNDEGCFCLNVTRGINRDDGCLLRGAMELYTCVGAFLILSYPHFLYADLKYRNGVLGMTPHEENHRIYMDIEPNTGTPVSGAKRAQFNIFMKPVSGIPATQNLRTTLTPIVWIDEGISLPEEFVDELQSKLLAPLHLLALLIPIAVAASALVLLIGVGFTVNAMLRSRRPTSVPTPIVIDNQKREQ